ncbi:MAG: sugar transferase [Lachnospiraceae bacterium]
MYQRKSNLSDLVIMILDCLSILVSLMVANYIRNGKIFTSDNERMDFGLMLGACLATFLLLNLYHNLYKDLFQRGPLRDLLYIIAANAFLFAGAVVFLYFVNRVDAYSRLAWVYFLSLDCLFMFILHRIFKRCLPSLYWRLGQARKILLVADRIHAPELITQIKESGGFLYDLEGIVVIDDPKATSVNGTKVAVEPKGLISYCQSASLDEIFISADTNRKPEILQQMNILSEMGITIHYQIPIPNLQGAGQKLLSQMGPLYLITYAGRIVSVWQLILKRFMDIVGALIGCVILGVITLIFAPLIKLESPGPVFFSQQRVGRNGRVFKMYKFRSMYADAEERKKELMALNEMQGLMFKMDKDPRITKIGAFMRKTSLDEFPQFINILTGDMSLVGTRPPTLDEFARYSPYHKKRLSFRPGLTGMWQVSGRSDITDFEEIVRLDVEYIEQWSIGLDIKILLKTLLAVIAGNGAK